MNKQPDTVEIEGLTINFDARRAFIDGHDMHLTRKEFALLARLARRSDCIVTIDELLEAAWGWEYDGSSHYAYNYIARLRRKMGKYSPLLETVHWQGYLLHSRLHMDPLE